MFCCFYQHRGSWFTFYDPCPIIGPENRTIHWQRGNETDFCRNPSVQTNSIARDKRYYLILPQFFPRFLFETIPLCVSVIEKLEKPQDITPAPVIRHCKLLAKRNSSHKQEASVQPNWNSVLPKTPNSGYTNIFSLLTTMYIASAENLIHRPSDFLTWQLSRIRNFS